MVTNVCCDNKGAHQHTDNIASLLVREQDRLLRGRVEARAQELAAAQSNAQMDTFVAIAGHELKTPLTSLKLSLQWSQRQLRKLTSSTQAAADDQDARVDAVLEQLGRTAQQMERLERLVNRLVDASGVRAGGKLDLRLHQVDLVALVREVVGAQRQGAPQHRIGLQCPPYGSVLVYADAGRIGQVVTNFLTNALKYTPADRLIEVGIAIELEQVLVWVRDEGPGLPAEELEQIWERFNRPIKMEAPVNAGVGLGLYLARTIVEGHHGQVGVQSTPGEGSTFWFTLPLYNPHA